MKRKNDYLHAIALAIASTGLWVHAGNEARHDESAWHAMRTLGRDIPANRGEGGPAASEPDGVLTLRRALELALGNSPDLAASAHGVRAAEGNARQAGAWPNPEIELAASEFGGTGARQGSDVMETSATLSQSLELGGVPGKRRRVAQSEARLAGWDYEAKRLDVLSQTKQAFVDVLLAQGQLALAESSCALAEDVHKAAGERVKAGKVAPLEETKAGVESAVARIARDRATRELAAARKRLAVFWGGATPKFKEAGGDLAVVGNVPALETFSAVLDGLPDVARWTDEVTLGKAALALAKAERLPAVAISAGLSRFEEDGTRAWTAGLSLPLPLFDWNAGGVAAAKHQATRAEYEQRAARLRVLTELTEAHSRCETARAEALTIKTEVLPGAQGAFEGTQAGYREGKLGYLDVLEAQRTLSEVKARYLDVLAAYHKAAADVERITGIPVNTIQ